MLLAHVAGASFVEAAITALAVGYIQHSFPEILQRGGEKKASASSGNVWLPVGGFAAFAVLVVFVAGMIKGSGHIDQWGGLDWNTVAWGDAGMTVLVSAVVSAIVLPVDLGTAERAPRCQSGRDDLRRPDDLGAASD